MKNLVFITKAINLALNRNKTILNFNENKKFKKELILEHNHNKKLFEKKNHYPK